MSILDAVARGADLKHFNEKKEPKNNFDAKKADKDLVMMTKKKKQDKEREQNKEK